MVMHTTYTNADGLTRREGPRKSVTGLPRQAPSVGPKKSLVVDFEYNNLPGLDQDAGGGSTEDTFGNAQAYIPANSYITAAYLIVNADWATADGGTLTIGLATKAGVDIDADGIDAAIAAAALDTGDVVACNGDLVGGTLTIGAADGYVTAAIANTFTTGEARLVIEYIEGRG